MAAEWNEKPWASRLFHSSTLRRPEGTVYRGRIRTRLCGMPGHLCRSLLRFSWYPISADASSVMRSLHQICNTNSASDASSWTHHHWVYNLLLSFEPQGSRQVSWTHHHLQPSKISCPITHWPMLHFQQSKWTIMEPVLNGDYITSPVSRDFAKSRQLFWITSFYQ